MTPPLDPNTTPDTEKRTAIALFRYGNPALMSQGLKDTLVEHAAGNYRVLMNLADELLAVATDRELPCLDEKLFMEAFAQPAKPRPGLKKRTS